MLTDLHQDFSLDVWCFAFTDYRQVLNLEPSNKQAATEIYKITRIVKEREDTERQKLDGVYNIILAVDKPVHLRSKVNT